VGHYHYPNGQYHYNHVSCNIHPDASDISADILMEMH
jgi:hypothetical protein